MSNATTDSSDVLDDPQVLLDGSRIEIPGGRGSLGAIRSHLEALALESNRVLWSFNVEGGPAKTAPSTHYRRSPLRVVGQTFDLDDVPIRLVRIALQQTAEAREELEAVLTAALIHDGTVARELWWKLAHKLKQPLLTLSLLPGDLFETPLGTAPVSRLRRWQLEQLGAILREASEACWAKDQQRLPDVLQSRVLSWLNNLQSSLELWHETLLLSRGC